MITLNGSPLNVTRFPDGTSQVWKLDPQVLKGDETAAVRWKFENEGEVMQLAQLADLLNHHDVMAYLDIDFLPYARQDKEISNDATFALRSFAAVLNGMKWDVVTMWDPHSALALELIDRSVARYYTREAVAVFAVTRSDVMCFPDGGAQTKYGPMLSALPIATASKVRDQASGHLVTGELAGEPVTAKNVLIIDDICDGGATFIGLAAKLREAGAASVSLFVSHGLFTRGVKALTDAGIDRVFTPQGEVFP
jgi:ribose-phosphate pyrophosphokinase